MGRIIPFDTYVTIYRLSDYFELIIYYSLDQISLQFSGLFYFVFLRSVPA